jgi:hypothetical protein
MGWMELAASFASAGKGGGGGSGASGYAMSNQLTNGGANAFIGSPFDNSNWTVATGGSKVTAKNASGGALPATVGGIDTSYLLIGALVLAVIVLKRHAK